MNPQLHLRPTMDTTTSESLENGCGEVQADQTGADTSSKQALVPMVEFSMLCQRTKGKHHARSSTSILEIDKHSPHIFISSLSIPVALLTVRHLKNRLVGCYPLEVQFDELGYYIFCREAILQKCYDNYNGLLLWEYPMTMQLFLQGQPDSSLADRSTGDLTQDSVSETHELRTKSAGAVSAEPRSSVEHFLHSQPASSDLVKPLANTFSSPTNPSTKARTLHGSESVKSNKTLSDISSTLSRDKTRCHICKKVSPLDVALLVTCPGCQRKFHKGCHKPTIQTSLVDTVWRCFRCVRKEQTKQASLVDFARAQEEQFVSNSEPTLKRSRRSSLNKADNNQTNSDSNYFHHDKATPFQATALSRLISSQEIPESPDLSLLPSANDEPIQAEQTGIAKPAGDNLFPTIKNSILQNSMSTSRLSNTRDAGVQTIEFQQEASEEPKNISTSTKSVADHIRELKKRKYTVASLYQEWPEYHSDHAQQNYGVKMQEIRSRPSRKQLFGLPAGRSRVEGLRTAAIIARTTLGLQRNKPRARRDEPEEWEELAGEGEEDEEVEESGSEDELGGTTLKSEVFDSLEELLGLPEVVVPVIHNGELGFREHIQVGIVNMQCLIVGADIL